MRKVFLYSSLAIASLFLANCSDNERDVVIPTNESGQIRLFIAGMSDVNVYSAAMESENRIEDCFVVIFNSSGQWKSTTMVDVTQIAGNGSASVFMPEATPQPANGDHVYVFCNTGLTAKPTVATTESLADLNSKFKQAKEYYFGGEALPMSGHVASWSANEDIVMTRSVAKVQVKLGETFSLGGAALIDNNPGSWDPALFNPSQYALTIINHGGKSDIIPDPSNISINPHSHVHPDQTFRGWCYGTYGSNYRFTRFVQYATKPDSLCIYISEYPNSDHDCMGNSIPADTFKKDRAFLLILGPIGTVVNGTTRPILPALGFQGWRLDFYDNIKKQFLNIKRNCNYTFTINEIRSAPYGFAGTLLNSFDFLHQFGVYAFPGNNIEYTITVEDSWIQKTYSNGQIAISISDSIIDGKKPFLIKMHVPREITLGNQTNEFMIDFYDRFGTKITTADTRINLTGMVDNIPFSGVLPATIGAIVDGKTISLNVNVNPSNYNDFNNGGRANIRIANNIFIEVKFTL